ncbi:MAG: hypothetical protein AB7U20_18750, partial [Planctomycetaceae bacterium]
IRKKSARSAGRSVARRLMPGPSAVSAGCEVVPVVTGDRRARSVVSLFVPHHRWVMAVSDG